MTAASLLEQALHENKLAIDKEKQTKLLHYLDLMTQWNRVFNLTTVTSPREMVYLHLIDSLIVQPYLKSERLLDVGSGAGLPGIPLAILNPHQKWTLIDKNSKKTRFLIQATAELGLQNVTVFHGSVQNFHPPHCFDSILSRAFGTIRLFAETTRHLLCPHGLLLAMKGQYPEEELADMPQGVSIQTTARLYIQGMDVKRHIVCLQINS